MKPVRPRRGLFWRVYLALIGALALVTFIGAGLWHNMTERPMQELLQGEGRAIAALLPPAGSPPGVTEEAIRKVSESFDGTIMLAERDCRLIVTARHGRFKPLDDWAHYRCLSSPDRVMIARAVRIDLPDGRILVISTGMAFGARHLHGLLILLSVAMVVGGLAYPLIAAITRRLERLRASVEDWGEGRADSRAAVDGNDEIAAVAQAFNAAADRSEGLLAAHKALLAHASHELRSPLARLRVAAELFAANPDPDLQASMNRDIGELDGLVEEILLASRLDHSERLDEVETVDCLALAAEEASRAGVEVAPVEADAPPFEVEGSPRLLRRLIRNLIENALKHGRPPVEIAVGRLDGPDGARITLTVTDHGPGIPEAVRERVFEPFYRPQGASEAAGSWGLGLALVRQIALRHGGTVRCAEAGEGLTRFVAELPAAPPKSD
ncbi:MAG: integral rane sensor signal transduction histidine kinase [Caulobacter sp.]|nr:integral rane sensor signal transduction histidine kinase [Caulobacter sp.]